MTRSRTTAKSSFLIPAALALAGVLAASAVAATVTVASSTFDADADGWTIQGEAQGPDYHATGGTEGGYISATDPLSTTGTSYWKAPAKFVGSLGQAFNGKLSYDIRDTGALPTFRDPDVVLRSGSLVLEYRQKKRPKGSRWTHFNVKLNGKKGWVDGSTGQRATPQQMQTVLSSLDSLLVRGEYRIGPEVFDIDNVVLKARAGSMSQ